MGLIALVGWSAWRGYFETARFAPGSRVAATQLLQATEMKDLTKMYGDRPCFIFDRARTYEMFEQNACFARGDEARPLVFLTGDSHSASLGLGLRPFLTGQGVELVQASSGWCEPTFNDSNGLWCRQINSLVDEKVRQLRPDVVVLDAHWVAAAQPPYLVGNADFATALQERLNRLRQLGAKRIVVVGQIPTWLPSLPERLFRDFVQRGQSVPDRTFRGVTPESEAMDRRMRAMKYPEGVVYFSTRDFLCNSTGCRPAVGPDLATDVTVWDYGHLTPAAAKTVVDSALGPLVLSQAYRAGQVARRN